MFDFKDKVAVVTGSAQGIGKCICEKFKEAGAKICVIDVAQNDYFVGDLANRETLERFADKVISEHGHIDYLINNAPPKMCGISSGSYDDFFVRFGIYYARGLWFYLIHTVSNAVIFFLLFSVISTSCEKIKCRIFK